MPGSKVNVMSCGGFLSIVPLPEDPAKALHGVLEEGPPLTQDLLTKEIGTNSGRRHKHDS